MGTAVRWCLAATLAYTSGAYDVGEDVTLCWATVNATMEALREDCSGAKMTIDNLDELPPTQLAADTPYEVRYTMEVPSMRSPEALIPHANIHSCVRTVGFCSPFVSDTPGLATHTEANEGEELKSGRASFLSTVVLGEGQYTIIVHARWFDTLGVQHDMARAIFRDVFALPIGAIVGAVLGTALFVTLVLVGGWLLRKHAKRFNKLVASQQLAFQRRNRHILDLCNTSADLAYPMNLISCEPPVTHLSPTTHPHLSPNTHPHLTHTSHLSLTHTSHPPPTTHPHLPHTYPPLTPGGKWRVAVQLVHLRPHLPYSLTSFPFACAQMRISRRTAGSSHMRRHAGAAS
jgi:hypothetical protein